MELRDQRKRLLPLGPYGGLDLETLVATLARFKVRFVLIGGMAARALGDVDEARDVDICHDLRHANLRRLVPALRALDAEIQIASIGSSGHREASVRPNLRHLHGLTGYSFKTPWGRLDCLGRLCTGDDFHSLASRSVFVKMGRQEVLVPRPGVLAALMSAAGGPRHLAHAARLSRMHPGLEERSTW